MAMMSSASNGIRWVPIALATLCFSGVAVAVTIVLSLISVYLPNRGTDLPRSNLCQISFAPTVSRFTGDFDNGGFLDLAVVNYLDDTTTVFVGNGNGGFTQYSNLSNGNNVNTAAIAVGDLANDAEMDIVIAYIIGTDGDIGVFLGEGNGSFFEATSLSSNADFIPLGFALGDIGTDNTSDLVVTDNATSALLIFRGNGDGTFTQIQSLSTAVANYFSNNVGVFLGDATGSSGAQTIHPTEAGPYALVGADFNRDGVLGITTGNYLGNSTTILLGNGDGSFRTHSSFSTGAESLPNAIDSADFNRDDIQDLIVANSGTDNVGILLGYGDGNFKIQKTYSTGSGSIPTDIVVDDFNRDNQLNFISTNFGIDTIGIFLSACP